MRVVKITPRGNTAGITIPREYMRLLKWRRGDTMYLEVEEDLLLVKRAPNMRLAARARNNAGRVHAK